MNFKDFRAGRWVQQYEYKSFSPAPVNQEWTWEDPRINTLLEQATQAIGELNAFSLIVPDVDIFIQMHVEAILSLRSEVEQTTLTLGKKAENAHLLLNHLYRSPFVTPNEVSQILNITHQTASSLIRNFEKLNILKKWEKVGRNQRYVFGRYFALFLD